MARSEFRIGQDSPVSGNFSPEAVREQIAKIAASEYFAGSSRMQRFLKLVVEYALAGRAKELKEYLIGVEVFDRDASFDPRQDPIVRVEARRLRSKLEQYYQGSGSNDSLLVEFSKGTYAPRFVERFVAPGQSKTGLDSIAVLPFRNLGPEPDHDYFSDGLSEELIHRLTTVPNLRVVAWHSAARLKSSEYDLEQVRQQLKVDTVLCGTVRRAGAQLRITVQLIDTAEGRYLWSEIYERRLQDLFAIEEEIACAIVNTLQIRLGRTSVIPSAKQDIHNVEAYNLYLLGRFHANRRTSEGLLKSIHCLERAVAFDTNNALAHGSLAESYSLAASYSIGYPTEYVSLARAAAHRALELDRARAEAYVTLAFVRSTYDWEWADAERLYRRAIELNPGYATAHHWFGIDHLALLGRWDEAWEEMELARRLDPLSAIILQGKGYLFLLTREYEKAVRAYEELIELDPLFSKGFASMGRAFLHLGRSAEAIEMFLKAQSLSGELPNLLGALGQAYAEAGMETAAREMLHKLKAQAEHGYVPGTCLALIHIGLAENEKALEYLEMGAQRRDLPVVTLKVHPAYDPLRESPRFQALLRTIGFS